LLEVVQEELRNAITPQLADPSAQATLGMIDAVLSHVIWRCDREQRVMRAETTEIRALAQTIIAAGADAHGRVRAALELVPSDIELSPEPDAIRRGYDAASELLSRCVEATYARQPKLWSEVETALEQRLARETDETAFVLVGREGAGGDEL
jgi:hypothetical protein